MESLRRARESNTQRQGAGWTHRGLCAGDCRLEDFGWTSRESPMGYGVDLYTPSKTAVEICLVPRVRFGRIVVYKESLPVCCLLIGGHQKRSASLSSMEREVSKDLAQKHRVWPTDKTIVQRPEVCWLIQFSASI